MNITREPVFIWSGKIRFFHWINVIAISILIAIGVVILNAKIFGVSTDGKVLLKTIHVIVGYVFATNLIFRFIFAFIGKTYERWGKMLPFTKGFTSELIEFTQHKKLIYKGHNPAGKLMVLALLSLLSVQMVSGLVIAGTDIYYPPFGHYFSQSIAVDKDNLDLIRPYSKENIDEVAYQAMRSFRKPFITAHVYSFYCLILLIPLHIIGVIVAERRERSAIVSAMVNGYKYLPIDEKTNH